MDVDPMDTRGAGEATPPRHPRLNPAVAITVALLATFMGICKVKDDNIVQAMQQAQADKIDHWNFYQARNLREEIAKATVVQLQLQAGDRPPERRADYERAIAQYSAIASDQSLKKEQLRKQAVADQQTYDSLNYRDDQFDLSDALLAIAISLLAIASLTQLWWLFALSLVPGAFGVLMGIAGLTGWGLHPTALTSLLS